MSAPRIGLTVGRVGRDRADEFAYFSAIVAAGGQPEWIGQGPTAEALRAWFERLDGLVLTGGGDIAPGRYGASPGPHLAGLDPERDSLEITLAQWAIEARMPLLGICRGQQVVNVALGGSLFQDISSELPQALRHDAHGDGDPPRWHEVHLQPGTRLHRLIGRASVTVNSFHHQAVSALGRGLIASAAAVDGIIEGIELPDPPFALAVQWHPERMARHPSSLALFRGLTLAAARR